ncbi:MAG: hypothetical protein V2I45_08760 [Halieaceae bacterium]|jgi:hypothetical protein|nr:hypothetical protein [Halieaceae bacterium]
MLSKLRNSVADKYRRKLREKAIERSKVRIALAGRKVDELDQDELEIIVKEEEEKLRTQLLSSVGVAALLVLGIT